MSSRPIYQTPDDLKAEMEIAREFVNLKWDCQTWKIEPQRPEKREKPFKYEVDYALLRRERIIGFAEIKDRGYRRHDFKTYLLGLRKWFRLREASIHTGLPALLVVRWIDHDYGWVDVGTIALEQMQWERGGTTAREDPLDIEPCAMIPIRFFKRADEC